MSLIITDNADELRRLKEDLSLAIKRAAEALREDPTRGADSARKLQLADHTVNALKRRIADIEHESIGRRFERRPYQSGFR